MKRKLHLFVLMVLMIALLAGCGQPMELRREDDDKEHISGETTAPEAEELSESDISITRQDYSRLDSDGTLLAEVYYDLVQLPETSDAYIKINDSLQEDFQQFLDQIEDSGFQGYLDEAADRRAEYDGDDWWNYYNTYSASIATCEDNILSVYYFQDWYMGGVANRNAYGLSFDLETGDPITLDSIAQTVPEHADFLGYLKSHIYWTMTEESKIDSLTMDLFPDLQLEDLAFYLDQKELIIHINTYQLASGAVGSYDVPTGLFVDHPQGDIDSIEGLTWYGLYPGEDGSIRLPIITLEDDGSFTTWGAYARSDAGVQIEGTYEIEHTAVDIVSFHGTTQSDGTYDTDGEYELIRIGDCIQLVQLGGDLLYKNDAHFTVWTLRTEVPM